VTRERSNTGKPQEVILWGANDFTLAYMDLLKQANIEVRFCVDARRAGERLSEIDIMPLEQLESAATRDAEIPIIYAQYDVDTAFWNGIDNGRRYFQNGTRLTHPVFIAKYLQLDYTGRVFAFGFPGSGNVLMLRILREIQPSIDEQRGVGEKEERITRLAQEYDTDLRAILESTFQAAGSGPANQGVCHKDLVNIKFNFHEGSWIDIYSVPSSFYLSRGLHSSHEPLDNDVFDLYTEMNYQIFCALRNPLDILVSVAAKVSRDGAAGKPAPPRRPQRILSDLDWFTEMASTLQKYYQKILNRQNRICVIRYEELIEKPNETIRNIAVSLGLDPAEVDAEGIWKKVGFRPLAANHLWRPGTGKWREFLSRGHFDILTNLGYRNLMRNLGYDCGWGFDSKRYNPIENGEIGDHSRVSRTDIGYKYAVGKEISFFDPGVTIDQLPRNLTVASNNTSLIQYFRNVCDRTDLSMYLSALDG